MKTKNEMVEESLGAPVKCHDTIPMDKPKNFDGLMIPNAHQIQTGQMIMMFQTPEAMVDRMNTLYDALVKEGKINKIHKNLVGKIQKSCGCIRPSSHFFGGNSPPTKILVGSVFFFFYGSPCIEYI